MNFSIELLIFLSSLGGIIFLFGLSFYSIRRLSAEEIVKELDTRDHFFDGLSGGLENNLRFIAEKFFYKERLFGRFFIRPIRFIFWKIRCLFSSFLDYIHGRHILEKNGCNGYWKKLDKAKKNGNGDNEGGKKETMDKI